MEEYKEYKPGLILNQFIDHYWLLSVECPRDAETFFHCVPNVEAEIVIHIQKNLFFFEKDDKWLKFPTACVTGIAQNIVYTKVVGSAKILGIRLTAEGFVRLFNMPVAVLTGHVVDLNAVFGSDINNLVDSLADTSEARKYIELVESFLISQLGKVVTGKNYLFEATRIIRNSPTEFCLRNLSDLLSIGSRQLQRTFKETYGVSPKTYQRIARFNKTFKYIQKLDQVHWPTVADDFGYADHPHLVRDFNKFTYVAPGVIRRPPEDLIYF